MPTRPKTYRPHRPPPRLKETRAANDEQRGSSAARGYGYRWQQYRAAFLRDHPLCVLCERLGRTTIATDVDHVKAVTGPDDPLFWEPSNHRGLCHSHHSQKTAKEDRGRKRGKARAE